MYQFISLIALLLASVNLYAQEFSGQILDSTTKEGIPFAQLFLIDYHQGVNADDKGTFSLSGKFPDRVKVRVSAFGYETALIETSISSNLKFYLIESESHIDVKEVTASGSRNDLQKNSITHVEMRSIDELNAVPTTNLGQVIEQLPGVYNSSTGNGVSKPVIRGLQGTRVVSVLNGIRIENQQWGGDHGMGITELGIGTVEVIKGPASLVYGADALGGVIYYADESFANQKTHELKASSQFESNSLGSTNAIFYRGSIKGLKINAGGNFSSHADFQLPSGKFAKNSRYQSSSGKLGLGWSKGKWISTLKYVYSTAQIGIPGHTHDTIIYPELFQSTQQIRKKSLPVQYFSNHIASFDNKFVFKRQTLDLLVGFTRNQLEEFEEKVTIPGMSIALNNGLYTFKMNAHLTERWYVIYGVQGMYQWQKNDVKAEERLVPNASQFDNGVFATIYYDRLNWRWQVGVRGDVRQINSESDSVGFPNAFNKTYSGYNFAFGGVFHKKTQTVRLNVSSGFRVPHLSELVSDGVHHGTLRYEKGNTNLRSEQAIQLDVTYEYENEHLSIIVNPFVSYVQHFVYLNPLDTLIEGFQVFAYDQIPEVYLSGFDAGIHYHPHFAHFLHFESTFSYIRGLSATNENVSLMPQPRWTNSLIWRFNQKTKVRMKDIVVQYNHFFAQNDVSQFESRSSSYGLLNFSATLQLATKSPLQLQVGARNLLNSNYIDHLSRLKNIGLESPGRNIYVKLIATINYEKK